MLEKFELEMYHKDVVAVTLDEGRKCMVFEKGCQPHQLPTTTAALKFHTLRALYQAGQTKEVYLLYERVLPSFSEYGKLKFNLKRVDDGSGIANTSGKNKAVLLFEVF